MKPSLALQQIGQCLWLDNITRTLLRSGKLARYIRDFSVTGLTSNPTIFEEKYRTFRDWAVPEIDEPLSDRLIMKAVRRALDDTEPGSLADGSAGVRACQRTRVQRNLFVFQRRQHVHGTTRSGAADGVGERAMARLVQLYTQ